ncbi:MAG: glutaredoxin family protein [Anaerolineae bacterium]|jgi:glutaredoxin
MAKARGGVAGSRNEKQVTFYGLSTCVWCKRTRQLLEDSDVAFDFVYVDLLRGRERKEAIEQVRKWNQAGSFPTLVVDGEQCVVGYKPDQIKEALGL